LSDGIQRAQHRRLAPSLLPRLRYASALILAARSLPEHAGEQFQRRLELVHRQQTKSEPEDA
jgi:hypothetical protein